MKRIFSLYILAIIGSLTAWAQDFVLTGRVMDGQENAIELASVARYVDEHLLEMVEPV